jgi:hypothetical protein
MSKIMRSRLWISVVSVATLIALAILAGGLGGISFRPGQRVGQRDAATMQFAVAKVLDQIQDVNWMEQALIWIVLLAVVALVGALLSPEGRRRLLRGFLRFAAIFWSVYFLLKYHGDFIQNLFADLQKAAAAATDSTPANPPPAFHAPQPSVFLIIAISLALALSIILIGIALARRWQRRAAMLAALRPSDELAEIARASLADLHAGGEWDDVIMNFYARMSRVVAARRGLHRQHAVTPSEFASSLERAGLPSEAVRGLTGLFERVRYGARSGTPTDVDRAAGWLNDILRSCGEAA